MPRLGFEDHGRWRHPDDLHVVLFGLVEADAGPWKPVVCVWPPRTAVMPSRRRDVDRLRVARLDDHRADPARRREVDRARGDGRIDDQRRDAAPAVAAVDGTEESGARAGVVRGVGFARADENRVAGAIVRVDREAADAVGAEAGADPSPTRVGRVHGVVGAPDAAPGGTDPHPALAPPIAERGDREGRDAARYALGFVGRSRVEAGLGSEGGPDRALGLSGGAKRDSMKAQYRAVRPEDGGAPRHA